MVLGTLEETLWSKSNIYAPVNRLWFKSNVHAPAIQQESGCLLTTMAVKPLQIGKPIPIPVGGTSYVLYFSFKLEVK
jgi:hypothetical protein